MIEIHALRESFADGELSKIAWIPRPTNVADAFTKQNTSQKTPIWKIMTKDTIELKPIGWETLLRQRTEKNQMEKQLPKTA